MSIVAAVVLSMLLLTVTGCATSGDPSACSKNKSFWPSGCWPGVMAA
jgi:Flp pilus assembly protein TadD